MRVSTMIVQSLLQRGCQCMRSDKDEILVPKTDLTISVGEMAVLVRFWSLLRKAQVEHVIPMDQGLERVCGEILMDVSCSYSPLHA